MPNYMGRGQHTHRQTHGHRDHYTNWAQRAELVKVPQTGNNRPSHTCLIQEYRDYTIGLSLYNESLSIPWVQVYTMSLGQYHESFSIYLYRTIRVRKKSNFTSEQIPFQIGTNHISHWNKSHFTFAEIPFHNGTNPISLLKKFHFTLEQIQFHIGTHPISHWINLHFSLEQIQFHIATNPI